MDRPRGESCFYTRVKPGMSVDAAKMLQDREAAIGELKRSYRLTQIGLWIAAAALVVSALSGVIGLLDGIDRDRRHALSSCEFISVFRLPRASQSSPYAAANRSWIAWPRERTACLSLPMTLSRGIRGPGSIFSVPDSLTCDSIAASNSVEKVNSPTSRSINPSRFFEAQTFECMKNYGCYVSRSTLNRLDSPLVPGLKFSVLKSLSTSITLDINSSIKSFVTAPVRVCESVHKC